MISSKGMLRIGASALWLLLLPAPASAAYVQTNMASDIPGMAPVTDPNLKNPWAIAYGPTSPFWISDNKTGLATLYNTGGTPQALVVTVPPPGGGTPPAAPTGQVFNGTTGFDRARFIFSSEDGTISAWNGGTSATLKVDNSGASANYKGLAIGNNGIGDFIYATNFFAGTIDVFNVTFSATTLAGSFVDPNIPAGYAPFGIRNIGGLLYVTYAKQDANKHDDVSGAGNGFVDVYDLNGFFVRRLASGGVLDSPWGLALAPSSFGEFSNTLLVGNFGDGRINAFDPLTGAALGALSDAGGVPIVIDGLWDIVFGNGAAGGDTNKLYFTAGIAGPDNPEDHGLFGRLSVVSEPGELSLLLLAGVLMRSRVKRTRL